MADALELSAAAIKAVHMSDHAGVAAALSQLDEHQLLDLYRDALRVASWVEGALRDRPKDRIPCPVSGCTLPVHEGPCSFAMQEAPLLTRRSERPTGLDDPELFPTGP
jgi:hypothetical protein